MLRLILFQIKKTILNTVKKIFSKFGYKLERNDRVLNRREAEAIRFFLELYAKGKPGAHKFKYNNFKPGDNMVINWSVPDIQKGGGGIMTILRFVQYLSNKGYKNRLYIIKPNKAIKKIGVKKFVNKNYLKLNDNVEIFDGVFDMHDSDILISTSWDSAYYNYPVQNTKLKAYFIQDYEPYFHPMSINYKLAEMTYQMGYYGIFAGSWLKKKIVKEFDMNGFAFNLGVDFKTYRNMNKTRKKQIVVYIRQFTKRRGSEFLLAVIHELAKRRNDIKIAIVGDDDIKDMEHKNIINYGIVPSEKLAEIYNESLIGLVVSLTNYSLVPQELMACGTLAFDVDYENNRVAYGKKDIIILEKLDVEKWVESIIYYIDHKQEREKIVANAQDYVKKMSWDNAFKAFEEKLILKK